MNSYAAPVPIAFHPKATVILLLAGLLAFPIFSVPSHSVREQWSCSEKILPLARGRVTAAGTAPDFHRIPFSSGQIRLCPRTNNRSKNRRGKESNEIEFLTKIQACHAKPLFHKEDRC